MKKKYNEKKNQNELMNWKSLILHIYSDQTTLDWICINTIDP